MISGISTRFGHSIQPQPLPPVEEYSEKIAGNQFLELRKVPPAGKRQNDWLFAYRPNAKASVHVLTIVKDDAGQKFVHLLVQRRPALSGKLTVELPAGLWGDQEEDEDILTAASREVFEETGYNVKSSMLLAENFFATSSGMSRGRKGFVLVEAEGTPSGAHREPTEQELIVGEMNVPLETFVDHNRFQGWLKEMDRQGYIVDLSIIAARGLVPPSITKKLDLSA